MEVLGGVVSSIGQWHTLLDNLNGKISQRQIELAQIADYRPPTRSIKKSGSTESLRPKDGEDAFPCFPNSDFDTPEPIRSTIYPPTPPTSKDQGQLAEAPKTSPLPAPLLHASSSPTPIQRRISTHRTSPTAAHGTLQGKTAPVPPKLLQKPTVLRKRKTGSIASVESQVPKFRTRSMIIVYYDSAVQDAFEELVKHISSSRNNMRKGKMAARMAEMRRLAELEVDGDDDDDDDTYLMTAAYQTSRPRPAAPVPRSDTTMTPTATAFVAGSTKSPLTSATPLQIQADDEDSEEEYDLPQLKYMSTRRFGPTRDGTSGATAPVPRGSSPKGPVASQAVNGARNASFPSRSVASPAHSSQATIYDELDAGLEWCQSECEKAAHQFLRDGECGAEIEGIKRRLDDVKETVERYITATRITESNDKTREAAGKENTQKLPQPQARNSGQSRAFREITMRKPTETCSKNQILEVDDSMDNDDEGIEDMDMKMDWVAPRRGVL